MWRPPDPQTRRPFSPEERRAIEQAIRAGRVQRIERGGWTGSAFDAPLWRELIRLQFAMRRRVVDRRGDRQNGHV